MENRKSMEQVSRPVDPFEACAGSVLHPKPHLNQLLRHFPTISIRPSSIKNIMLRSIRSNKSVCKTAVLNALKRDGIPTRASHRNHGRFSTPPYGYKLSKGMPARAKLLRLVLLFYKRDRLSKTAIARKLQEMGLKTRAGHTHWHHHTIHQILKRNSSKP